MEIHDGFLSGKPMTIYNNNVYFFPLKPFEKDIVWLEINITTRHEDHHSAETTNTKIDFHCMKASVLFPIIVLCAVAQKNSKSNPPRKKMKSSGSQSTGLFLIIQKNTSDNAPFDSFVRVLLLLTPSHSCTWRSKFSRWRLSFSDNLWRLLIVERGMSGWLAV